MAIYYYPVIHPFFPFIFKKKTFYLCQRIVVLEKVAVKFNFIDVFTEVREAEEK